jgi:hypothetical protein
MSESATDTSDSELEFEEPEEPSPLPAIRPSDLEGAMQYDTIKAIWAPRNRYPNVEKIKSALVAFKDIVKTVRDQWKTQSQALKDAENQNNNDKAAEFRQKVVQQRQLINVAISTTIDKGHPIIVEKYVSFPPLPPTLLARRFSRICRSLMQNTNIYHVIISKWIVSELKKIVKCRERHLLSTDRTHKCAVSSLLRDFANKLLRLDYVENTTTNRLNAFISTFITFPSLHQSQSRQLSLKFNVADNFIDLESIPLQCLHYIPSFLIATRLRIMRALCSSTF